MLAPSFGFAQQRSEYSNTRRNVATVIFSGLGGAVLGLSTLSFYGKPQDHTGNIYAGLGLGLLVGVGYVMMQSSDGPYALAPESLRRPRLALSDFEEFGRSEKPAGDSLPIAGYAWTF